MRAIHCGNKEDHGPHDWIRKIQPDRERSYHCFGSGGSTQSRLFRSCGRQGKHSPHNFGSVDESGLAYSCPGASGLIGGSITILNLPTSFLALADEALNRFSVGYHEYGPGAADELGLAGQWGDLHRKVGKLKRAMWEGDDGYLQREGMEEILHDVIGHCLLALDMKARGLPLGRASSNETRDAA